MTKREIAKGRVLEELRAQNALNFKMLQWRTYAKDDTLRTALKELLEEGRITRRKYRGFYVYFIRRGIT